MDFTGERVVPGKVSIDLFHEHVVRYLFAKEYMRSGQYVLDAGCGTGYGTSILAEVTGVEVVGVDVSNEAVEYATEHYATDNCTFRKTDLLKMTIPSSQFDGVVCFEVIEHLDDPKGFLLAIKSSLKSAGFLMISTPNRRMYSDSMPDYKNPYHVREYYYDEFRAMLVGEFQNVQIYAQDFVQGMTVHPLSDGDNDGAHLRPIQDTGDPELDASFFVAICSDDKLPTMPPYVFPFSSNNILAEKDRYIAALRDEVKKRDDVTSALSDQLESHSTSIHLLQAEVKTRDMALRALQEELKVKTEWVEILQQEVLKRDEAVYALQNELDVKTQWVESLQQEVLKRDETTFALQRELSELTKWTDSLKQEVTRRDEATTALQNEIQVLTDWVKTLKREVEKSDEAES